jgi:hypothetical protein
VWLTDSNGNLTGQLQLTPPANTSITYTVEYRLVFPGLQDVFWPKGPYTTNGPPVSVNFDISAQSAYQNSIQELYVSTLVVIVDAYDSVVDDSIRYHAPPVYVVWSDSQTALVLSEAQKATQAPNGVYDDTEWADIDAAGLLDETGIVVEIHPYIP